jgi:superfamily II DNA or RNA helicase
MTHLPSGIYEQVIHEALKTGLRQVTREGLRYPVLETIDGEEARHILASYIAEVLCKGLQTIRDNRKDESLSFQVDICNRIISLIAEISDDVDLLEWRIGSEGQRLLAILDKQRYPLVEDWQKSGMKVMSSIRPETALSISTLFTGSSLEPSMVSELKREIQSADRIDMLVSFIKWSGLRLIIDDLRNHAQTHPLRIITTSYMGATELKAAMELAALPNTTLKISYDIRSTRLHAKSYMFYRETGFSTVYIGSSNLSSAAIGSGLEWNIKVTEKDMPHIVRNVQATFETYWNDSDFQTFTVNDAHELSQALHASHNTDKVLDTLFNFRIEPYPFQMEILERLDAERRIHGRYRNLIVAATGTGKTVISAFDYKRFCKQNTLSGAKNRLLFVAHRQEILEQSLKCFRGILRDANFGECWYGKLQPTQWDYLFISIQTFNSKEFQTKTPINYYDFIIVDEFHHAAAQSYKELLSWYHPKVLLGLTATPERMDGRNIVTEYFDGVMAAEIRLPEAINRQLLVPFQYFGITDDTDISMVHFDRGRYDEKELENVYTANDMRTKAIINALMKYVDDIKNVIGLGFCVGVEHAKFMARWFSYHCIPSVALHGSSTDFERRTYQRRLITGEIRFIFTADLYNEGVDIPEVNTVLFLRPTESLTVFLQQLGRGLRICDGKDVLTVLDFIGQVHQQYNFESKFRALMGHTHRSVQKELDEGFSSLPHGCWIHLEKLAKETVLKNIKDAIINKRRILSSLADYHLNTGIDPTLELFMKTYETLSLKDIYTKGTFHDLCVNAGVRESAPVYFAAGKIRELRNAFLKLSHIDSQRWIHFLIQLINTGVMEDTVMNQRMLMMFHYAVWEKMPKDVGMISAFDGVALIRNNRWICAELLDLLKIRYEQIAFVDKVVDVGFVCPLDLHCSYTRDEILAAVGLWDGEQRPEMREGVKFLSRQKVDLFFINLHKSEKDFSPSTMYEDYAISDTIFHWQSQSTTSADSTTGQRYIHHKENGSLVLLFVRDYKSQEGITLPYIYLGKVNYVNHEGSRPMNIIWRLEEPMPAALLQVAAQAGVG